MVSRSLTSLSDFSKPNENIGAPGGDLPCMDALILDDFDRSAPMGTGTAKMGGNYAPVFKHANAAKKAGYGITLHVKLSKYFEKLIF